FLPTPTTSTSTLSLHDALPILHGHGLDFARFISNDDSAYKLRLRYMLRTLECEKLREELRQLREETTCPVTPPQTGRTAEKTQRSEEHTSELQSRENLVCRLLL